MERLSDERRQAIRERVAHATKNWRLRDCSHGGAILLRGEWERLSDERHEQAQLQVVPLEDAEFIANARQDVPDLLAALEQAEGELAELRERMSDWQAEQRERAERVG